MRFFVITILFLSILLIGCETTQETMKPEPEPEPEPTQVVSVIKGAPPPQLPEPGVIRSQAEIMRILREAGHKNYADKIKETGIFESAEKRQRRPVVNITIVWTVSEFRISPGWQFPPVRTSEQVLELRSNDTFMPKFC